VRLRPQTEAANLGARVDSGSHDFCPTVSPDGRYLFLISQRNGDNKVFWVDAGVIGGMRPTD
jgi:Tol biopolymer transport system component